MKERLSVVGKAMIWNILWEMVSLEMKSVRGGRAGSTYVKLKMTGGRLPNGLPLWLSGKEFTCQCRRPGFNPWAGKSSWKRNGNPLQYSCVKSHGPRSLAGYSPWRCKELDTTE